MNFHFDYRLKTEHLTVGAAPRQETLVIDCLENLDDTIDALFDHLKITGDEALLEDLCPYFGVVWPSALALAAIVASETRAGDELLEIGCGLALPSLVAARAGARVVATDSHPEVPRFLARNIERNLGGPGSADRLEFLPIDWQKTTPQIEPAPLAGKRFARVIGSDILYERKHPPLVARVIDEHLAPGGQAIVTDPGRPYLQNLADEMKARGYRCETQILPVAPGSVSGPSAREIFVLKFERANAAPRSPGAQP